MNFSSLCNQLASLLFFVASVLVNTASFSQSNVQVQTIPFAIVDGQELNFDIYYPKNIGEKPMPVMVWMHGGGFSVGSRDNTPDVQFMQEVSKRGYIAISVSYRLLRKGKASGFGCDCAAEEKRRVFREASKDFWQALIYINEHAEELHIDRNYIMIGGSSAGAEGVLNAVYNTDWVYSKTDVNYDKAKQVPIAGVLSLAGAIVDVRYVTETSVPAIFYHGTKDKLVPYATAPHHYCSSEQAGYIWLDGAETIANKLATLQTPFILATFPNAGHEISGVPFNEMDQLMNWIDELFIQKQDIQLRINCSRE